MDEYENVVIYCRLKLFSGQTAFVLGLDKEVWAFYFHYPQAMRGIRNEILSMHCGKAIKSLIITNEVCLCLSPHLSVGTAVQARLWEVPAVICCIETPSRPITFLGLVTGVEVWPCPH